MESINPQTIYWSLLRLEKWSLYIASTDKGLCFVGSQNELYHELVSWAKKRFPNSHLVEDLDKLKPYEVELREYFEGKRKKFTFPVDLSGTVFQRLVWKALDAIPYGETRSYSEIANDIKKPTAVRAVGAAVGANPVLITIPCHRVLGKNGSLTGYRGGTEMKKLLLKLEAGERI